MQVWAIANQKGGVGKTTTAVSLAGVLSKLGKSVLLIDLDPHGSMSAYFKLNPDTLEPSIYHLFQTPASSLAEIIVDTNIDRVKLLPSSTAVATLDRQLGSQAGKGLIIKNALLKANDMFDYCLIDCAPLLGILMVNALAAAQKLLVPVQTEFLAIKGLERMLHTLEMILKARAEPLEYLIIPTMFDRRTRAAIKSLRKLRESYAENIWDNIIPIDTLFREASHRGKPISHVSASSRGAKAYVLLLEKLMNVQTESSLAAIGH